MSYINTVAGRIEVPNKCPHCHHTITPDFVWAHKTRDSDNQTKVTISAWNCVNQSCQKLILTFLIEDKATGSYTFKRYLNGHPISPIWEEPIVSLQNGLSLGTDSPEKSKFIKTYNQSLEAESRGLDEIAGMGFRKAIEYLVKDWAIQIHPDEKEKIIKMYLGNVVKNYYEGDLKDILERAVWLGNDETHYTKLFDEFDINNLKELIDLIVSQLYRDHKINHYKEAMKGRK